MSLSFSPQPQTQSQPGSTDVKTVSSSPTLRRKFPPPCWTHEESVTLIEVYRQKWFSLRRTNLRSNDWESVAEDVARRCPLVPSPKSAVQCRHKMDKLRKRYREEKQRALAHPDRFLTSWVLFHLMDSLENYRSSCFSTLSNARNNSSPISGIKRKASGYRLGTVPSPRFRDRNKLHGKAVSFTFDSRDDEEIDEGWDDTRGHLEADGLVLHTRECNSGFLSSQKRIDSKNDNENSRLGGGFPLSTFGDRISPQSCSVSKVRVKVEGSDAKSDSFVIPAKLLGNDGREFKSAGFNLKNHREFEGNSYSRTSEFEKRRSNYESERSEDSVADILSSINTVGQEFLKLEKMKMQMAQEIEKRRMKMEMKHTELILQFQLQIVDSFAKSLVSPES